MKKLIVMLSLIMMLSMTYYAYRVINYDSSKTVEYITLNSGRKSKGMCAYYVRKALIAGGIPAYIKAPACLYSKILPLYGFKEIPHPSTYREGDIVIFPSVKNHHHGHIAMWNGKQWVSDFKQEGIIVNPAYNKVDYQIWRNRFDY